MVSLSKFKSQRFQSSVYNRISPGTYRSVITYADEASSEKYAEGTAIELRYTLTDSSGNSFSHQEIFFLSNGNSRTARFLDYLEENNILPENLTELVGCQEEVIIRKNGSLPSIVDRKYLGRDDEGG